jgi:peptide/nickel transport system substrate-binding protein
MSQKSRRIRPIFLATLAAIASAPALAYQQAPALDAAVESRELPGVDERLPANPYVYEVTDRIGDYGGTWRRAIRGGGDQHNFVRTIGYHNLVRWDRTWTDVEPHVAESVEANADSTEFTFRLREGMRWSDGEPFDADDIMFWYEDVLLNEALTPGIDPLWASSTGAPVTVEKVDNHTVTFSFDAPYATFLDRIAYGFGAPPTLYPEHYLSQFHIDHNPDGIDALIAEQEGVEDWVGLFNSKVAPSWTVGYWQNPDLPTMHPWVLTNEYGAATRVIAERNPYYFGVDPEGNQLPYIDRVVYDQVEDNEVVLLKALNGEIDYQLRHIDNPENKGVIIENAEAGVYRLFDVVPADANQPTIYLNLSHSDPVKREIFNNKDFRIALSHAIDREEIIDVVYLGQGVPSQAAPRPDSPFHVERLANQYLEYDPDLANEMLDAAGFAERDADGWRLGPDGEPIVFVVQATPGDGRLETMEIVARAWQDIGINAQFRQVDRSLMTTALIGNDYDAYIWDAPGGMGDSITDPRGFLPFNTTVIFIAPLWAQWNMNPETGEEPPAAVREQLELYRTIESIPDAEGRIERMKEVLEMAADQFYSIGIRQRPPGFGIAKTYMGNILDPQLIAGPLWRPAPDTVQFFIEADSQ